MNFAAENWLLFLLVLPLLLVVFRWSDRRARERLRALFAGRVERQLERYNPRLEQWRRFLTLAGLFCLIIALARPQWGASEVVVTQKGTDIVIALDVSNSMLAEDVPPNRLGRAKAELGRFLEQQRRSRVGLVLFAGAAFVQCPLTIDYGTTSLFLRMAAPDMISQQGTAIANALEVSRDLLEQAGGHGEAFRAILLVTDGEDLEGAWADEARHCVDAGIMVIPVGIGEETGGLIPLFDNQGRPDGFMKDNEGNVVMTRLDLTALEQLAAVGGGSSFRVGVDGLAGERLRQVLDRLGERDLEERRISAYQERFAWPLSAAVLCFLIRFLIAPRRRGRGTGQQGGREDLVRPTAFLAVLAMVLSGGLIAETVLGLVPGRLGDVCGPGRVVAGPLRPEGAGLAAQGRESYLSGEYETALQDFEAARALAPDDPRLSLAVGETLHRLERYQDALTEFQRAYTLTEAVALQAESLYNAGTSLLALGDPAQAAELLRQSLALEPGREDALLNLEIALRRLEEQQEQEQQEQDQQQQDEQ